jgi:hypothetical protein
MKRIQGLLGKSERSRGNARYILESALELSEEMNQYISCFGTNHALYFIPEYESRYAVACAKSDKADERKRVRNAERELMRMAERAQYREKIASDIERWKAGEKVQLPYNIGETYLRVDPDDNGIVQTILGAEVPREHAAKLYKFICGVVESGVEWISNGHTFKIGVYGVDKIEADGTLHAGCHVIKFDECRRVGETL